MAFVIYDITSRVRGVPFLNLEPAASQRGPSSSQSATPSTSCKNRARQSTLKREVGSFRDGRPSVRPIGIPEMISFAAAWPSSQLRVGRKLGKYKTFGPS